MAVRALLLPRAVRFSQICYDPRPLAGHPTIVSPIHVVLYVSFMSKDKQQPIFRVIFINQGQVYELYARQIFQSELWGFLEIEELVFGERSQMLVDPGEEKLKSQFEGVNRSFIPLQAIVRIDEVERVGQAKISEAKGGSNVMSFPMPPGPGNN